MERTYEVVEHFVSINGEGPLAGQLAVFVLSRAAIYRVCIVTQSGPMSRMCRPE